MKPQISPPVGDNMHPSGMVVRTGYPPPFPHCFALMQIGESAVMIVTPEEMAVLTEFLGEQEQRGRQFLIRMVREDASVKKLEATVWRLM
jgi:hypothetical protein